jgi:hypothetical protein
MLENLEPTTRVVVDQVLRVHPRQPYAGQFWTQVETRLAVALDGCREPFLRLLFSIPLTVWFALVYPAWAWRLLAMNPQLACVSFT